MFATTRSVDTTLKTSDVTTAASEARHGSDLKLVPLIDEVVQDLSVENFDQKLVFHWKAKREVSYRLEKATNLDADMWIRLDQVDIGFNGNRATAILAEPAGRSFFRIVAYYE